MRPYTVFYLAEKNDSATDLEHDVSAENIMDALTLFEKKGFVKKRITGIQEKPNVQPNTENHG